MLKITDRHHKPTRRTASHRRQGPPEKEVILMFHRKERDRPRSLTQKLIDDLRWHIGAAKFDLERVDAAKHVEGLRIEDMRWHIDAAKEDLERVAAARPMRWLRDHAVSVAAISLVLAAFGYLAGSAEFSAQQRAALLQSQLTDVSRSYGAMTSLVNNQVAKGNISLRTVQLYLPGGPGLSLAGQTLVITSPATPSANAPAVVPSVITVTGTINISNRKLKGRNIWILLATPGINRVYPEGSWPDRVGPAILDADHHWASPSVTVGAPGDKGRIFYVIAVLADKKASGIFWHYLKTGASTDKFPGLDPMPRGAIEYDRVEVVRS